MFNLTLFYVIYAKATVAGLLSTIYIYMYHMFYQRMHFKCIVNKLHLWFPSLVCDSNKCFRTVQISLCGSVHVNSVLQMLHMGNNLTIPNYNNTIITTPVNGT